MDGQAENQPQAWETLEPPIRYRQLVTSASADDFNDDRADEKEEVAVI